MLYFATILAALGLMSPAFSADLAGCQPKLIQSMCYTQVMPHWALDSDNLVANLRKFQERKCRPLPENLKQTLLSVYDKYPREIQQAFCEIKKVFIVSGEVSYGALADYYFDLSTVKVTPGEWNPHFSGRPIGYVLEISEKNRFKGETGSAYLTRVLQARFGNARKNVDPLPVAKYETPFGENGALATTIVHEIGHMLGRSQKATSTYFLPLSEGKWSKQSFKLDGEGYALRHASPEYGQMMLLKQLSLQDVRPTFEFFRKTGVASLYGAANPQEDFAEFFMFNYYGNLKWSIQDKVVFDLQNEMARNPAFQAKKEIIRTLMTLPEPFSLKTRGPVAGEIGPM